MSERGLLSLFIVLIFFASGINALRARSYALPNRLAHHARHTHCRGGVHNSFLREMGLSQAHASPPQAATATILNPPNFAKHVKQAIAHSPLALKAATMTPSAVKSFLGAVYPGELLLMLVFRTSYSRLLKFAHRAQIVVWKAANLGTPNEWKSSILGFMHERSHLLSRLITFNYCAKLACGLLTRLGISIRPDLPDLLSRISYALFLAQFADLFKAQFLRTFFPQVSESKRQSYIINKSASVAIWTIGGLVACEMVSSYLKVPLSSTLAFGGVGGLAVGLSLRDIAANFMGGMMLLFNEPFTPGDMVTFKSGKTEIIGRVERVGWGQTRIRGRDTRPTYVPNSHFAQAAVTNMERITHRKFEAVVPVRFEDYGVVGEVVERVKERLRGIPKLDTLSMPFRVSFIRVAAYCLEIEITCYFATKSIDEFLSLQQMANMEVIAAIHDCGADLALPTSLLQQTSAQFPDAGASANPSPFSGPRTSGGGGGGGGGAGAYYGSDTAATVTSPYVSYRDDPLRSTVDTEVISEEGGRGIAIEMELAEALQGIPLPSQDGSLPMGTDDRKAILPGLDIGSGVYVPAGGGRPNRSPNSNTTAAAATIPRSTSTSRRPSPSRPMYGGGPFTPTTSNGVGTDVARSAVKAGEERSRGRSVSAMDNANNVSSQPAAGAPPVALSDLWQESVRSAGIVPDGRKYFTDSAGRAGRAGGARESYGDGVSGFGDSAALDD